MTTIRARSGRGLRVLASLAGCRREDGVVRGPGRVGWAWIDASSLAVVLGAGYWVGARWRGVGVAAGGLVPLWIERPHAGRKRRRMRADSIRAASPRWREPTLLDVTSVTLASSLRHIYRASN